MKKYFFIIMILSISSALIASQKGGPHISGDVIATAPTKVALSLIASSQPMSISPTTSPTELSPKAKNVWEAELIALRSQFKALKKSFDTSCQQARSLQSKNKELEATNQQQEKQIATLTQSKQKLTDENKRLTAQLALIRGTSHSVPLSANKNNAACFEFPTYSSEHSSVKTFFAVTLAPSKS